MAVEFIKAELPALSAVIWNGRMLGYVVPLPIGRHGSAFVAGDGTGKTGASLEGFEQLIVGENYEDCKRRVVEKLERGPVWPEEK